MAKFHRSAKIAKVAKAPPELPPAAEIAINPVVAVIKEALKHPWAPGETRSNFIWDQHSDPEVREASLPLDRATLEALSPEERGRADWDRLQRIKAAFVARDRRLGVGRMLFERVRAALDRCLNEYELLRALLGILEDDIRSVARQAVGAANSARASKAARGETEEGREKMEKRKRRNAKIWNDAPEVASEEGKRNVARILGDKYGLTPGQVRRVLKAKK
jgi:hypothetical protein